MKHTATTNARKANRQRPRRRKSAAVAAIKWIVGLGLLVLLAYVMLEFGGIAYGEDALSAINFSDLTASQKRRVLKNANQARCTCGCGLGLAECVATDSTCPIRTSNIDRIKTMVQDGRQ